MLERLSFLIVLLALCAPVAQGQTPPAHVLRAFEQGNAHYRQERYDEALLAYTQVLDAGFASGALFYNMGGAYYRTGRFGQALRHYEKARRLMPGSARLRHNLRLVRSRLDDPPMPPRPPLWQATGQWLARHAGPPVLFVLGLLLYLPALALLTYRGWTRTARPRLRRAVLVLLPAGGLLIAVSLAASAGLFRSPRTAVISGKAAVRAAPTVAADTAATLPEGALLDVIGRRDGWQRVRLPDGPTGWLAPHDAGDI